MKKLVFPLMFLAVMFATGCEDAIEDRYDSSEAPCFTPAAVTQQPLSGSFTFKNIPDNEIKTAILINSQALYTSLVQTSSGTLPAIDFTKQVLVAIRVKFPSCVNLTQQSLNVDCKTITYSATNGGIACSKPTDFYLFTLIDVKYKDHTLALNVSPTM